MSKIVSAKLLFYFIQASCGVTEMLETKAFFLESFCNKYIVWHRLPGIILNQVKKKVQFIFVKFAKLRNLQDFIF